MYGKEIANRERLVFFQDECHVVWGDLCGYVWAASSKRVKLPVANERKRKTYYGALNILSGRVILKAYDVANTVNTVDFLKGLLRKYPKRKITVIWDNASFHRSISIRNLAKKLNKGLDRKRWRLELINLAPYAPEENPIEFVWLHGKRSIRSEPRTGNFDEMQDQFAKSIRKKFNFNILEEYRIITNDS